MARDKRRTRRQIFAVFYLSSRRSIFFDNRDSEMNDVRRHFIAVAAGAVKSCANNSLLNAG